MNDQNAAALLRQVMQRDFPDLELYNHQRSAIVNRLAHGWQTGQFSTLLSGDVGTGKTVFYLVFLRCVRKLYQLEGRPEANRPSLAIVPAQIKEQWRTEALTFSNLSPLQYLIVDGTQEQRIAQLSIIPKVMTDPAMPEDQRLELLIINYALARRKVEQQLLQSLPLLGLIVDESHRIKSAGAQQTVATKSIDCEFMVCGSGTQMTKGPQDLWSILHAMLPGKSFYRKGHIKHPKPTDKCWYKDSQWDAHYYKQYKNARSGCRQCYRYRTNVCDAHTPADDGVPIRYRYASPQFGSYNAFLDRYCKVETVHIGKGRYVNKIIGAKNLPNLRRRIQPYQVRWKKSEVLDLPDIYYQHYLVDFEQAGEGQSRMYEELKAGFINQLSSDGYWSPIQLKSRLAQLTYVRRSLCLSPRAFYSHQLKGKDEMPKWVRQGLNLVSADNAKVEWLMGWLKENVFEADAQALVFSQWTTVTKEIRERLAKAGYGPDRVGYATGEMTKKHNEAVKNSFNAGNIDIAIGSPAISEGLNYQGSGRYKAYCVIMDVTWTPKTLIQTIGRLYRAKQESIVEVVSVGVRDTFDQWMLNIVKERQGWIQEVLDGDAAMGGVRLFSIQTARQLINAL